VLKIEIIMINLQLIRRHNWRNERARKNQFIRSNKNKCVFVMHLDPCDSNAFNKMIFSPSGQKIFNHFQKNSQTASLFSFGENYKKEQKNSAIAKLAALKGTTAFFFSNQLASDSEFIKKCLENNQAGGIVLGLINKDYFFNRLDISKLLQLEKNQVELLRNRLNSFII
jgi:hypothetical protein